MVSEHKQPALSDSRPKMTDKVSMGFCRREESQDTVGRGNRERRRGLQGFVGSKKGCRSWTIG